MRPRGKALATVASGLLLLASLLAGATPPGGSQHHCHLVRSAGGVCAGGDRPAKATFLVLYARTRWGRHSRRATGKKAAPVLR